MIIDVKNIKIQRSPDTLQNNLFNDALFTLYDNLDNSKQAQFQLSGLTAAETVSIPLESTGYIDLPLGEMFTEYQSGANVALARLVVANSGTAVGLFQWGTALSSWKTLAWIYAGTSLGGSGAANNRWHCNFRLPGDYKPGSDLTLHLSSTYVVVDNSTAATAATIGVTARRNIPSAGKEGFGTWVTPDTWTPNTTLVIGGGSANVLRHTVGSCDFDANTFGITGSLAGFPLTAGNLVQLEFSSSIDSGGATNPDHNTTLYFANFYITYTKRFWL